MPPVLLPRSSLEQVEAMLLQPRHAEASTTHGTGPSCGIVIDSLSQLLLRHSTQKVGACFPGPLASQRLLASPTGFLIAARSLPRSNDCCRCLPSSAA